MSRKPVDVSIPTTVYLFYDKDDRLLYVGITDQAIRRFQEHEAEKGWWPQVVRAEIEHLPSRAAALAREAELIKSREPRYNISLNEQNNPKAAPFTTDNHARERYQWIRKMLDVIRKHGSATVRGKQITKETIAIILSDQPSAHAILCLICWERKDLQQAALAYGCEGHEAAEAFSKAINTLDRVLVIPALKAEARNPTPLAQAPRMPLPRVVANYGSAR